MKNLFLSAIIFLIACQGTRAQNGWTNRSRLMPDKLKELPVGIIMSHDPNPCYPVMVADTFYWKHHTKAMAVDQELTVVECGSFIWYDLTGWHANMSYSPEEFAKDFECPSAILKPNQTYTYQKNWRYGKQAYGGDALWYIIAKDKNGKLYKGTALIETEATLLTQTK